MPHRGIGTGVVRSYPGFALGSRRTSPRAAAPTTPRGCARWLARRMVWRGVRRFHRVDRWRARRLARRCARAFTCGFADHRVWRVVAGGRRLRIVAVGRPDVRRPGVGHPGTAPATTPAPARVLRGGRRVGVVVRPVRVLDGRGLRCWRARRRCARRRWVRRRWVRRRAAGRAAGSAAAGSAVAGSAVTLAGRCVAGRSGRGRARSRARRGRSACVAGSGGTASVVADDTASLVDAVGAAAFGAAVFGAAAFGAAPFPGTPPTTDARAPTPCGWTRRAGRRARQRTAASARSSAGQSMREARVRTPYCAGASTRSMVRANGAVRMASSAVPAHPGALTSAAPSAAASASRRTETRISRSTLSSAPGSRPAASRPVASRAAARTSGGSRRDAARRRRRSPTGWSGPSTRLVSTTSAPASNGTSNDGRSPGASVKSACMSTTASTSGARDRVTAYRTSASTAAVWPTRSSPRRLVSGSTRSYGASTSAVASVLASSYTTIS